MVKVNAGLRYDIGNLLKHGKAQKYGCARKKRVSVVKKSHFDFVEEKFCADGLGIGCARASLYGVMIPNDRNRCKSCYMDKVNPEQIVLDKDAKVDVEHVVKVVRMRSHGLLHLYRKEVKSLERFAKRLRGADHILNLSQSSFFTNAVRLRPSFVRALNA